MCACHAMHSSSFSELFRENENGKRNRFHQTRYRRDVEEVLIVVDFRIKYCTKENYLCELIRKFSFHSLWCRTVKKYSVHQAIFGTTQIWILNECTKNEHKISSHRLDMRKKFHSLPWLCTFFVIIRLKKFRLNRDVCLWHFEPNKINQNCKRQKHFNALRNFNEFTHRTCGCLYLLTWFFLANQNRIIQQTMLADAKRKFINLTINSFEWHFCNMISFGMWALSIYQKRRVKDFFIFGLVLFAPIGENNSFHYHCRSLSIYCSSSMQLSHSLFCTCCHCVALAYMNRQQTRITLASHTKC